MWSEAMHPPWLQGPDEEDAMSDTDSDEELDPEADRAALEGWPTIEESKTAFLETTSDKAVGDSKMQEENAASVDGHTSDEIISADIMLPRDITMALLSQRRALARKLRWDAIPEFVKTVDSAIQLPKSKLTF